LTKDKLINFSDSVMRQLENVLKDKAWLQHMGSSILYKVPDFGKLSGAVDWFCKSQMERPLFVLRIVIPMDFSYKLPLAKDSWPLP
jgi:hypothetical protein